MKYAKVLTFISRFICISASYARSGLQLRAAYRADSEAENNGEVRKIYACAVPNKMEGSAGEAK
jgi:hypothetical protein